MAEHPTPDLDAQIRRLVARAVSDAPPAPDLEDPMYPDSHADLPRRWWFAGGAAVLAAAAAVVALLFVVTSDEDSVQTPVTQPTTATTALPTPAPTTVPETDPDPTAPSTTPGIEPPTPPSTPPTEPPAEPAVPPIVTPGATLSAGPDGVVGHVGATRRRLTDEPAEMALTTTAGGVILQHRRGDGAAEGYTDAETVPLVVAPDGSVSELFDTSDWDGAVLLHDVEIVDGRELLLFSLQVGWQNPDSALETLYVVDLGSGERTEVGIVGEWEAGTSRLHLATTGLIAGRAQAGARSSALFLAVPGSPAASQPVPTPGDLGLPEYETECRCPIGFTVAPDATTFAWFEKYEPEQFELVVRTIDGNEQRSRVDGSVSASVADDIDFGTASMAINHTATGDPVMPPVIFTSGGAGSTVFLDGLIATMPPGTAPTAPAPPVIAVSALEGVALYDEAGQQFETIDETMSIALPLADGRVVGQRETGVSGGQWSAPDTVPFMWNPAGTTYPLYPDPGDTRTFTELHDVATVGGRTWMLYSTNDDNQNPELYAEHLYAYELGGIGSVLELGQIAGWEGGTSRLHLATNGLIVGEAYGEAVHSLLVMALPESPAEAFADQLRPGLLGLERSYFDCTDCPRRFTTSTDGSLLAWLDGDEIVRVPLGPDGTPGEPTRKAAPVGAAGFPADLDLVGDGTTYVVSYWSPLFDPANPPDAPILVDADGQATELPGLSATAG